MTTSLRKSAGAWLTRIFLFILVISFAIWGVADFLGNTAEAPLASVADTSISAAEFNADFRRELFRLQQQYGPEFTTARARELGFDKQVLRQMLIGVMYDREAENLELTTADETVAQNIRENAAYRDALGEFDPNIFRRTLNDNGFTEKEFMRRARMDLTRRQLIAAITSGTAAPQKLAASLYTLREEQRVADLLFIPQDAIGKIPAPSETELTAFHKANEALFTAPEYRTFTFVTLQPEDLADAITPDEKELRENYEARLGEFTVTALRNLQQFVLPDEAAAKAAHAKIKAGASFALAAKQAAGLSEKELELLEVTKEMLPTEIAEAVFAMQEGEVSQPLKSALGWHLVKITSARQQHVQPFEEVRNKIARELALSRAVDLTVERMNQFEDARAGGATLEEAAKEFGFKLRSVAGIDRDGNAPDGKPVQGIPLDPQFITGIFDTDAGAESDLRENKDGGYYVLRVDAITPSAVRPLGAVRAEAAAAWRAQRTGEKLSSMAAEYLKAAEAGKALAEIAKPLKLKVSQSPQMGRSYADDQISAALTARLFAAKPGETIAEPSPKGGYMIARLRDITPPAQDEAADKIKQLSLELGRNFADDLQAQFQAVLERRYEVSINLDRLASLGEEQ